METRSSSDDRGNCSSGEFREHGNQWQMMENQKKVLKLVIG
jgi:hypothetical protein